jgi:hypothetical protein
VQPLPSISQGIGETVHPDTISLQPPPPRDRPERHSRYQLTIKFLGSSEYFWASEEKLAFCARKPRNRTISQGTNLEVPVLAFPTTLLSPSIEASHSHSRSHRVGWTVNCRYIVVGIIGHEESIPHETLLQVTANEPLFKQIRKAERKLRSPLRRLLSLKRIGAFGLYR